MQAFPQERQAFPLEMQAFPQDKQAFPQEMQAFISCMQISPQCFLCAGVSTRNACTSSRVPSVWKRLRVREMEPPSLSLKPKGSRLLRAAPGRAVLGRRTCPRPSAARATRSRIRWPPHAHRMPWPFARDGIWAVARARPGRRASLPPDQTRLWTKRDVFSDALGLKPTPSRPAWAGGCRVGAWVGGHTSGSGAEARPAAAGPGALPEPRLDRAPSRARHMSHYLSLETP
jgi:hypothetical protein